LRCENVHKFCCLASRNTDAVRINCWSQKFADSGKVRHRRAVDNFINLVYTSDFAVRCDLDRNNPAQIIPYRNFENRSISVFKQRNRLKNSSLTANATNTIWTGLLLLQFCKFCLHVRFHCQILQSDAIRTGIILLKSFCIAISKLGVFLFLSNATD
jgi:hypothetical protein